MPKPTGKDHARINLDIWGDEDWLDLTPPAQHLYFILWTSPQLTYCGTGHWHPGKIAAKSQGWTAECVDAAAVELARELFLVIDTATEEFLLRSWIKHDGLWKTPNLAVSMANARADLASRTLRAVIVHEVSKLKSSNQASNSWERGQLVGLLKQKKIDPATLPPYEGMPGLNPPPNPGSNPTANPPSNPYGHPGVNPPSNPGPTPTTSPTSLPPTPKEGYVTGERHLEPGRYPNGPRPECVDHVVNSPTRCTPCRRRREWDEDEAKAKLADELANRRRINDLRDNCPVCHGTNVVEVGDEGDVRKCDHGQEQAHA